ncbi:MAG: FAD-dependent oxidoreductase [Candidatus Paceibacterota bacterium]
MQKENYEIWFEGVNVIEYPRTVLPSETEVLIIGGGITGITSAYLLSKNGKKVILLEKGKIGESVTKRTTGFLTQVIDIDSTKLIKLFGMENSRLILESHQEAISDVEKIIKSENIDCEFTRCSNFVYANNKNEENALKKMAKNYKKLGVNAEYKENGALKFNNFGYIEFYNQAKFNAIKYITSLAQIATKNGAIINENITVLGADDKKDFVEVKTDNSDIIKAKKVLSATYSPFGNQKDLEHKYNMYRSYVVEYRIPSDILVSGTYQDTLLPYHYFRVDKRNDFDRLVIGGADNMEILNLDHEVGARIIQSYTKNFFKNDNFEEVSHWSGLISEPAIGLAYIGESNSENIFYAFGFSGNGMTYSYIASKIFADQMIGQNNPYSKIYSTDNKLPWWKNIFL